MPERPAAARSSAIREPTPACPAWGEDRCAADAVFVCASRRPHRAGDNCRRDCFGRVHMHLEAELGRDAGALDQPAEASDCERCTPLGNESEDALVPAAPAIHPRYPRAVGEWHYLSRIKDDLN